MAVVYRHIRLDKNEPFYIGIGKTEARSYRDTYRNSYWSNIVKKTNYKVEILFDDLTWDEAVEKEKEFIQLYGRKDLGTGTLVNLTDGGEGLIGCIFNEQHRKKISEANKSRKHSEETKEKIGLYHRNKITSIDIRNKMSESHKGKTISEETKKKISEVNKGKIISEETKEKIRLANKGKKMSEETKKKISETMKNKKLKQQLYQ